MGGKLSTTKGFTLLEMMIVVAIVAFGTVLIVPAFTQWISRYQMSQASSELAGSLNLARMAAKNRNAPVTATFVKAGDGTFSVTFGAGLSAVTLPAFVNGGSMTQVTNLGPPPTTAVTDFYAASAGNVATVQFSPQGVRSAGGLGDQTFVLQTAQGLAHTIVIGLSGKVRHCAMSTCP
jgi:prepilin-type N-terminal cleavage/methylation domain-containing protein